MVAASSACNAVTVGVLMRKNWVTVVLLASAACAKSSDPSVDLKDVTPVQARAAVVQAGAKFLRPGLWQAHLKMEDFTAPNMPPNDFALFKQIILAKGDRTVPLCVAAEGGGDQALDQLFKSGAGDCHYRHFKMGAGQIAAEMVCTQGGAETTTLLEGRYDAEAYHARGGSTTKGGSGQLGETTSKISLDATRSGDCS